MARKASAEPQAPHGFNDIIGLLLLVFAVLLLASLLSYDWRDVSNKLPADPTTRNLIGPFGAYLAFYTFLCVGVGAYVLPVLMVFIGLGVLLPPL